LPLNNIQLTLVGQFADETTDEPMTVNQWAINWIAGAANMIQ
jgi:hypothetical protein